MLVGPDLRGGQCVQLLIPGNTFHTARLIRQGIRGWFLGASTEWPGVETVDVEIGDVEALAAKYPNAATISAHSYKVTAIDRIRLAPKAQHLGQPGAAPQDSWPREMDERGRRD
jgi:hypothetical protein